jgi:F0F1-type ATP synthase assembly protein I
MPFHRPIPESKPPEKDSSGLRGYIEAEKLMQVAFILPSAVVIGWGIGWWADSHLHQHWIAIAGIVFGSVAGLYYVIQQAVATEKNSRKQDPIQNGTDQGNQDNPS